jgi:hypothetical protein
MICPSRSRSHSASRTPPRSAGDTTSGTENRRLRMDIHRLYHTGRTTRQDVIMRRWSGQEFQRCSIHLAHAAASQQPGDAVARGHQCARQESAFIDGAGGAEARDGRRARSPRDCLRRGGVERRASKVPDLSERRNHAPVHWKAPIGAGTLASALHHVNGRFDGYRIGKPAQIPHTTGGGRYLRSLDCLLLMGSFSLPAIADYTR